MKDPGNKVVGQCTLKFEIKRAFRFRVNLSYLLFLLQQGEKAYKVVKGRPKRVSQVSCPIVKLDCFIEVRSTSAVRLSRHTLASPTSLELIPVD